MAKKKDEVEVEQVTEQVQEEVTQATEQATEPVEEVIETHPEQPDWLIAMQKMFTDHTQKIDSRFDAIESRLPQAEKGNSDHAKELDKGGTSQETSAGGGATTEATGESKPVGNTKPGNKRLKLWRHF